METTITTFHFIILIYNKVMIHLEKYNLIDESKKYISFYELIKYITLKRLNNDHELLIQKSKDIYFQLSIKKLVLNYVYITICYNRDKNWFLEMTKDVDDNIIDEIVNEYNI